MRTKKSELQTIPVLPLRDVVVFPYMVMPLFVGRPRSIHSLDEAMNHGKQLLLVSQKQPELEEPGIDDLYDVGTIANIIQLLKLPDGTVKVLVEGQQRAQIYQLEDTGEHFQAQIKPIESTLGNKKELQVVHKAALDEFQNYVNLNKKVQPDILSALQQIENLEQLSDTLASHLPVSVAQKQTVLEMTNVVERFEYLLGLMQSEADLLQVEKRIRSRVKKQMEKSQRDYYLNEQIKAIQKELGEEENAISEIEQLRQKIEEARMPLEAREKAEAELVKKWTAIREAREAVTAAIEPLRTDKTVGSSLQAEAEITAPEEIADYLNTLGEELRFALLVSKAEVKVGDELAVTAKASDGEKCERCWHYTHDVGAVAGHETICKRCADNVDGKGEDRHYA